MNRERAKSRIFELLDARNPQPVPMTPKGIQHLAAELVHSIVDAIADELEAEAAAPPGACPVCHEALDVDSGLCRRSCYHNDRGAYERAAAANRAVRQQFVSQPAEAQASDPKGRKGYDY